LKCKLITVIIWFIPEKVS